MNAYVHRAEANRQKIMELFDTKYSFIDPDDIEVFQVFFEHHVRRETEFLSNGGLRTPLEVYDDLGDISLLPEVFIQRIKERFREKKDEYDKKMGARKSTPRKSPNENSA